MKIENLNSSSLSNINSSLAESIPNQHKSHHITQKRRKTQGEGLVRHFQTFCYRLSHGGEHAVCEEGEGRVRRIQHHLQHLVVLPNRHILIQ